LQVLINQPIPAYLQALGDWSIDSLSTPAIKRLGIFRSLWGKNWGKIGVEHKILPQSIT